MTKLFEQIESLIPKLHGWASVKKCQMLAASVIALQPETSVIIGVWGGRDALSLGLAHKYIGRGRVMAIDPWVAVASVQGQVNPADREWWSNNQMHEQVYGDFLKVRSELQLNDTVLVHRMISDYATPPKAIQVCVIDGNHGEVAIRDATRFGSAVSLGGFAYLDDLNWSGGAVAVAAKKLEELGFSELFKIDTGAMYQRIAR